MNISFTENGLTSILIRKIQQQQKKATLKSFLHPSVYENILKVR